MVDLSTDDEIMECNLALARPIAATFSFVDPVVRDMVHDLAQAHQKALEEGRSPFLFSDEGMEPQHDEPSDFHLREALSRSSSELEAQGKQSMEELMALADADAGEDEFPDAQVCYRCPPDEALAGEQACEARPDEALVGGTSNAANGAPSESAVAVEDSQPIEPTGTQASKKIPQSKSTLKEEAEFDPATVNALLAAVRVKMQMAARRASDSAQAPSTTALEGPPINIDDAETQTNALEASPKAAAPDVKDMERKLADQEASGDKGAGAGDGPKKEEPAGPQDATDLKTTDKKAKAKAKSKTKAAGEGKGAAEKAPKAKAKGRAKAKGKKKSKKAAEQSSEDSDEQSKKTVDSSSEEAKAPRAEEKKKKAKENKGKKRAGEDSQGNPLDKATFAKRYRPKRAPEKYEQCRMVYNSYLRPKLTNHLKCEELWWTYSMNYISKNNGDAKSLTEEIAKKFLVDPEVDAGRFLTADGQASLKDSS